MTTLGYDVVVGIDPSLTGTGIASLRRGGHVLSQHYGRAGALTETLRQRSERRRWLVAAFADWIPPRSNVLVVIEDPAYGAKGGATWDRAGLWGALVDKAFGKDCDVVAVGNKTHPKWVTGKGSADKAACAAAIADRYGVDADCDNCSDAAALVLLGAHALGWIEAPEYARDVLTTVHWPPEIAASVLEPYERLSS